MDPFREQEPAAIGSVTGITSVERLAGTDTLVWEGVRLIVRSPHPMPEWHVGKNRKTTVHFRGKQYAVVGARTEEGEHEYTLDPWTPRANEIPALEITYDERYVLAREEDARSMTARRREAWAMWPLWPFLGFLPSPWKRGLHERYGFGPVAMTRFSVWLELGMLGVMLLWVVLGIANAMELYFVLACLVDGLMRASILIEDEYPAFGFAEWAFRPQLVATLRKGWERARARMRGR